LAAGLGQLAKGADAEPRRPIRLLLAVLRTPRLSCRNREAGDRITAGHIAHLGIPAEVADDRNPVKRTGHDTPSPGLLLAGLQADHLVPHDVVVELDLGIEPVCGSRAGAELG